MKEENRRMKEKSADVMCDGDGVEELESTQKKCFETIIAETIHFVHTHTSIQLDRSVVWKRSKITKSNRIWEKNTQHTPNRIAKKNRKNRKK